MRHNEVDFRNGSSSAMVLDAIEGDLVTKSDFAIFKEHVDRKFGDVSHRFEQVNHRFNEMELRLVIKLGLITVTTTTIAVAILTWLIKIQ